ncbi:MAG TPA: hypothetical protein VJO34_12825 [Methylomirabilota bacterium]|nr:hypothetical protein [Methylomirabilota bacterium]
MRLDARGVIVGTVGSLIGLYGVPHNPGSSTFNKVIAVLFRRVPCGLVEDSPNLDLTKPETGHLWLDLKIEVECELGLREAVALKDPRFPQSMYLQTLKKELAQRSRPRVNPPRCANNKGTNHTTGDATQEHGEAQIRDRLQGQVQTIRHSRNSMT